MSERRLRISYRRIAAIAITFVGWLDGLSIVLLQSVHPRPELLISLLTYFAGTCVVALIVIGLSYLE